MTIASQGRAKGGSQPTGRGRLQDPRGKAKARARGRATDRGKNDASRGGEDPQLTLALPVVGSNLQQILLHNQSVINGPQFSAVRSKLAAWEALGADHVLLSAIRQGIRCPLVGIPRPTWRPTSKKDKDLLMPTIEEYLSEGVIKKLDPLVVERTAYWVPVFPRQKAESEKFRLITNFKELNAHMHVPHHRAESWKNVLHVLQREELTWGITLDMQNWFHNLSMHKKMARWMRFAMGEEYFDIVGMPFGWGASPWWSAKMAKPIRAWLHRRSWPHLWWVDDVLLLGRTKVETEQRAVDLISLLTSLGVKCNMGKCMKTSQQVVKYVGHLFNLQSGEIHHLEAKHKQTLKMVKKQAKASTMVPRYMAMLAGNLLDTCKSNVALEGLAQQLMRETASAITLAKSRLGPQASIQAVWSLSSPKSLKCGSILQAIRMGMDQPCPRMFRRRKDARTYVLTTDSSLQGWGAQLSHMGQEVDIAGGLWDPKEKQAHITHLEAAGSANAVMALCPHLARGDELHLLTDASSTMFAWKKGSKLAGMNQKIQEAKVALHRQGVYATYAHIPGKDNYRADWLSRNHHKLDPTNYKLLPSVFHRVCRHFDFAPEIDLFASFLNHQLPQYCSGVQDRRSWGDALLLDWGPLAGWCNPPWNLTATVLRKVEVDKAVILICLPVWESAPWWGKFLDLLCGPPLVWDRSDIFTSPQGTRLPPPRWRTCFGVLRG